MNQTIPTADLNTAGTTDVIPSVAIDRIIAQVEAPGRYKRR